MEKGPAGALNPAIQRPAPKARPDAQPSRLADERQFRLLVESVTDYAIYMLSLDGYVSNWNAGAQRAKGYAAAEIVGQHFSRFYTPQDQIEGIPAKALDRARTTGSFESEGWRVRKDGSQFWAHVVIDLIRDDDGIPIGFAKITKDRTEQRAAQMQALDSERRFRHLVEGITDYAIYMLDLQGRITNWNAGAARANGYAAAEIVGQHFSQFYTADDRAAGRPAHALTTARTVGSFEAEGWRLRKDGSRFWAHVVIDLIKDDDGIPIGFAKITKDRTEQRIIEATALESERRFRHFVEGVTDYAIYMLDIDGRVTNWNAGAERAKGYRADEIVGQHFSRFYTAADRAADLPAHALETARKTGSFEAEGWRVRKDGCSFWAHVVIDAIPDETGTLIGFAKITRDITRQKQDAERISRVSGTLDAALSNMKHGLCVFDASGTLQLANRPFLDMFDHHAKAELVGLSFGSVVRDVLFRDMPLAAEAVAFCTRHRQLIDTGTEDAIVEDLPSGMPVSITHAAMPGGGWVSTFEDITQRKRADQDSLTGLANRRAFHDRIHTVITTTTHQSRFAVLLLDLDDFKSVNDTYGHGAGDAVLKRVAAIARASLRPGDMAARLGGDEFAIFLDNIEETEVTAVAERLIAEILASNATGADMKARVGVSIGVALASMACRDVEQFLSQADMALYDAKNHGKGAVHVYSAAMSAAAEADRAFEADFCAAATTGTGLTVLYQPIMDTASRAITAREALLRWTHPTRGVIAPSIFMPLAATLGLTPQLGTWVLDRACRDAARWTDGARVTVNVSPLELGGHRLTDRVLQTLVRHGLPPALLEIEITETTLLDDGSDTLDDLRGVHALGVKVALDDFGRGFSSLAHVQAFPFDRIKLEGSFVRDALTRPGCAVIVGVVAELGRRLGIAVVAEGVETQEHLDLVIREGCHEVQGYLIGYPKAMPEGEADAPARASEAGASWSRAKAGPRAEAA